MNAPVRLAVFCDIVGDAGGTERYLGRVLPELARRLEMRLFARHVVSKGAFGVPSREMCWSGEHDPPSQTAARRVACELRRFAPDVTLTSNVFDAGILSEVRRQSPHWLARVHDHRPFCPNGDRVFPQFHAVCSYRMGSACSVNAIVRGCVCGPRAETGKRIRRRVGVRDALRTADAVLVASAFMADESVRNGIDPQRIALLPPPIAGGSSSTPPLEMPGRSLLFAGRIVPQKGLASLFDALAYIAPPLRPSLIVAGSGTARDETAARAHAQRIGIDVEWRGWLDERALRACIDDVALLVVPSLWPEPFGLIGIEAQARGRPAVAYDAGGIREWLGGAGYAVPRGDSRAFARAIVRALDPNVWRVLANEAVCSARRYDLESHVARLHDLCRRPAQPGLMNACASL